MSLTWDVVRLEEQNLLVFIFLYFSPGKKGGEGSVPSSDPDLEGIRCHRDHVNLRPG